MLSDVAEINEDFEESFTMMMSDLKNNFTIPKLTKNMRNCEHINNASHDVEEYDSDYELSLMIEKLPPPTSYGSGEAPILIRVHKNNFVH